MFQSPGPIAFHLGPLAIRWYGIIIGAGVLCAYFYAVSEIRRRKLAVAPFEDMALWLVIAGVVGARLYYVLFNLDFYAGNPLEIFQVWKGGLAIHGGLIGGGLAYFIYTRRRKISALLYADAIIPGVLLAQAFGRFGNFFNNEAFGTPTELPWKLFIPESFRPPGYEAFSYFHPTFLYESLWNILGFIMLVILSRKIYKPESRKPSGYILFAYMMWYSVGRFFIESLRTDSLYIGPLRTAQVMSVVLFLVGVVGLILLRRKTKT